MKRLLLSTAAIALLSGAASAADLPVFEAPAPMVAPTPVGYSWSGVYLGIHGGYGWGDLEVCLEDDDDDDDDCVDLSDDPFDLEFDGPVLGGQIGVNWQWNWFVLGVEGDASWSGIGLSDDDDDDDDIFDDDENLYDFLASARLRAGIGLDRLLVYGTGGIAFANTGDLLDLDADDDDDDDDDFQVGWVAGGGVEFAVTDNVTLGAEYLHYEFEDILDTEGAELNGDVDVIRGRVNVKFGGLFGG